MSGAGRSLVWARRVLIFVLVAALVGAARPTPRPLFAGSFIATLGEALRLWAAGHLIKTTRLTTTGPYAWTRNPLYLGRLLLWTGLALAASLPRHFNVVILAAGYAVFFLYYMPRKERVEGRRLHLRHGAIYENYRAAVPALVPRRAPFGGPRTPWSLALVVRSGEPLVLAGLVLAFGLLALKIAAR